jgi:hypothetical protein
VTPYDVEWRAIVANAQAHDERAFNKPWRLGVFVIIASRDRYDAHPFDGMLLIV